MFIIVPESLVCRKPCTCRRKAMQLQHMSVLNLFKKKLKITSKCRIHTASWCVINWIKPTNAVCPLKACNNLYYTQGPIYFGPKGTLSRNHSNRKEKCTYIMQHCSHQCTIMRTECKIVCHNIDVKDVFCMCMYVCVCVCIYISDLCWSRFKYLNVCRCIFSD